MARRICFLSYKGGVGKTSLAVNVGVCLAQEGHRVLLVDLDTQANASMWLLGLNRWNRINTSGIGSLYSIFNPGHVRLADCLVRDAIENSEGRTLVPGLDLVPTAFDLVDLESDLESGNPDWPPCTLFQEQLEELEDNYDLILFDCPPNTLRASQCGIFASDEIYVPATPDTLSLIGFTLLGEKLRKVQWALASYRKNGMGSSSEIQGVIFNGVREEADFDVARMRMRVRLNQFRSHKKVSQEARIFDTRIRDTQVLERAILLGRPVPLMGTRDGEIDGLHTDYRNLAGELLRHDPAVAFPQLHENVAGF